MAPISADSSTAQISAGSRRTSRQIAHISSSVRLKHCEHGRTFSVSVASASARRRVCSAGWRSRWYVRRRAVFLPMPGSRASSPTRASLADTLERQLEREVHAARELRHLLLCELRGLLLRLSHRDKNEVFEHLDIRGLHDGRIDSDAGDLTLSVRLHGNHATARGRRHRHDLKLILNFFQPALHLLSLLQNLVEVSHLLVCVVSIEQLEIEKIDSRVEHWIVRTQRRQPLGTNRFCGEPRAPGLARG